MIFASAALFLIWSRLTYCMSPESVAAELSLKLTPEFKKLIHYNITQFCSHFGYPLEIHPVTTKDGYTLEMHRIPHGKNDNKKKDDGEKKGVVFLQHGLFSSSWDWIVTMPNRSLAFALADKGYDVWMGNFRGNDFSQKHKTHDINSWEFWKFTWHEMGVIDLPTMIDYALKKSEFEELFYVGHSQGTTTFFVMASSCPKYNKKIKTMFALSPVAYLKNTKSLALRALSLSLPLISAVSLTMNWKKFNMDEGLFKVTNEVFCKGKIGHVLCANALFAMTGFNPKNLDYNSLPLYMTHSPSTTGLGQIIHFGQVLTSGRFCQFDYGPIDNMKNYKSLLAPLYPLEKITSKIILFYSKNDLLCSFTDVDKLAHSLNTSCKKFVIKDELFSHMDYLFGNNVNEEVNERVIKEIEKVVNNV